MRAAVVGHVEWLEFVPVEHVPRPGEIVHADESWEEAAGGGVVAAVQLAQLADSVLLPHRARDGRACETGARRARGRGIEVHATSVDAPQRSGFTYVDEDRRADDHDDRPEAPSRAGTTTRSRGTSSLAVTRSTSAPATRTLSSVRAEAASSSPRPVSSPRFARRRSSSTRSSRAGRTRRRCTAAATSTRSRASS